MSQNLRAIRESKKDEMLAYGSLMVGCYASMPQSERDALHAWDRQYVTGDGRYGTHQWPGWEKYIGPYPELPPELSVRPKPKATIPDWLRWDVWCRDNYTCRHCSRRDRLTVDHIIPESRGGETVLSNLQTLCRPCNSRKGTR